jgi:dTDP-4-amino-4,6-dideoxygalactose transaminase
MQKKIWPNFSKNLISKVSNVIKSGKINYTTGKYGKKFEYEFSKYVGNKYSVAICNGTAALEVAIKSLKLPKRSEIIVPARSFFASASCIVNTGYTPVFVDVDLLTQNVCLKDLKKKINWKTKAIVCVHLAGLPCDMYGIKKIAKKNKIKIIEDCSQAHGASINNKQVGSFGDVSTWSFCNDKIISTLGEGGMISTNNKKIYEFCKRYINHGTVLKIEKNLDKFIYSKDYFGTNLRITEIQSIAGLEQLKNLEKIQIYRDKVAKNYFDFISKYQKYFYSYYPSKEIKSAWYRFYFFVKINSKDDQKTRYKIIKDLKKKNLRCFTGSCPEIYLEKSFRKLKGFKQKRLKNCKILGETSIALDIDHTIRYHEHKENLLILKNVIEKILKDKRGI